MSRYVYALRRRMCTSGGELSLAVALCVSLSTLVAPALVQAADVVLVEEDWELVLDQPGSVQNAPQLETVISPFGHIDSLFGRATWNYRELPDYIAGGLQLQAWNGDHVLIRKSFGGGKLSTTGETISWTQRLQTDGVKLRFRILNGRSTTWGLFGGSHMEISGNANLPDLNGYSTDVSVSHSAITFGSQRAIRLRIKEVRRYGADGDLLSTDRTSRVLRAR